MTREGNALLLCAAILWAALTLPGMREALESTPPGHMLVQMPLLAWVGVMLGWAVPPAWQNRLAGLGLFPGALALLAVFTGLFWMVPRAMDLALEGLAMEALKFVTLPLLLGMPLGLAWPRLGPVGRGILSANLISMLAFLGWLYREAPIRVCNNYLIDQQQVLGDLLLFAALGLAVERVLRGFAGPGAPLLAGPVRAAE